MNTASDIEIRLNLLKLLKKESELTQREMNRKMGVSLGKINYCISVLTQKGMIKVERFKKAEKKAGYLYRLTPKGFEELARLMVCFLKIRIAEYDQIKTEIKLLLDQINKIDPRLWNDPELIKKFEEYKLI